MCPSLDAALALLDAAPDADTDTAQFPAVRQTSCVLLFSLADGVVTHSKLFNWIQRWDYGILIHSGPGEAQPQVR